MSAAYGGGDTSTNAGNDNSPFPGYLRNNYANDLQNGASMTICHGMVQSKLIVPKCLVGKYSKRRRACIAYMESTVVDISIHPPSFKHMSLYLSRFPLSNTPKQVFF